MDGDGLVHDDMIFNTAIFPNNDTIRREFMSPFRKAMKDVIYLDNRPMEKRIHLSFYDDKATNIWKNLAVGTNMAILYDKELKPDYMVNSVLSVFEKSSLLIRVEKIIVVFAAILFAIMLPRQAITEQTAIRKP